MERVSKNRLKPGSIMGRKDDKTVAEAARSAGTYPEEAYHFVREGLNHAVEQIHGPVNPALMALTQFLTDNQIDPAELYERIEAGSIDSTLAEAIEDAGGYDKLNRHVNGQELCWALRDFALERWGTMADLVLRRWKIRGTLDFGRIVFTLIEHDFMQGQPRDRIEDFNAVYDFSDAFEVVEL